jgi:hypothetical protein
VTSISLLLLKIIIDFMGLHFFSNQTAAAASSGLPYARQASLLSQP